MCTRLFDFIKQMKQTNEFKRSLFENTKILAGQIPEKWFDEEKSREEALNKSTLVNELVLGYSKRLEIA